MDDGSGQGKQFLGPSERLLCAYWMPQSEIKCDSQGSNTATESSGWGSLKRIETSAFSVQRTHIQGLMC